MVCRADGSVWTWGFNYNRCLGRKLGGLPAALSMPQDWGATDGSDDAPVVQLHNPGRRPGTLGRLGESEGTRR